MRFACFSEYYQCLCLHKQGEEDHPLEKDKVIFLSLKKSLLSK